MFGDTCRCVEKAYIGSDLVTCFDLLGSMLNKSGWWAPMSECGRFEPIATILF
jgi:hypothetical protein